MKNGSVSGWILGIISVIVVAGGVAWNLNINSQKSGNVHQISTPSPKNSPSVDPNAWKGTRCDKQTGKVDASGLYVSGIAGFSVQASTGWKTVEYCHDKEVYQVTFEAPDSGEPVSTEPGCMPCHQYVREFRVNISNEKNRKSPADFEDEIKKGIFFAEKTSFSKIKLGGINALKVDNLAVSGITEVYVWNDDKKYIVGHFEFVEASNVESPEYSDEFERFLKSFRFI